MENKSSPKQYVHALSKSKSEPHSDRTDAALAFQGQEEGKGPGEASPPSGGLHRGQREASHPLPSYPWVCRKNGQEGVVSLEVFTNEEGNVQRITLDKSSGYDRLDKAALKAVQSWVFSEGKLQKIIQISFVLDQDVQEVRERMTIAKKM